MDFKAFILIDHEVEGLEPYWKGVDLDANTDMGGDVSGCDLEIVRYHVGNGGGYFWRTIDGDIPIVGSKGFDIEKYATPQPLTRPMKLPTFDALIDGSWKKEPKLHRDLKDVPTEPAERRAMVYALNRHPVWDAPSECRCLMGGIHNCVEVEWVYVNPLTEKIEDDETLNTAFRVWLEAGRIIDQSKMVEFTDFPWAEESKWIRTHDLNLNCGGPDLESALLELAVRIDLFYLPTGEERPDRPESCGGDFPEDADPTIENYVSRCVYGEDGYCMACGFSS